MSRALHLKAVEKAAHRRALTEDPTIVPLKQLLRCVSLAVRMAYAAQAAASSVCERSLRAYHGVYQMERMYNSERMKGGVFKLALHFLRGTSIKGAQRRSRRRNTKKFLFLFRIFLYTRFSSACAHLIA